MSFGLSSTKRSIGDPAIAKGIVGEARSAPGQQKPSLSSTMRRSTRKRLGGVVPGGEGDVLGLMQARPRVESIRQPQQHLFPSLLGLACACEAKPWPNS